MKHKHPSTTPGCTQTATPYQSASSGSVVAPSEEISAFLEQVKSTHPKSAILSLVEHRPHPHPLPKRVIRHFPSPLTPLFNQSWSINCVKVCPDQSYQGWITIPFTAKECDAMYTSTNAQSSSTKVGSGSWRRGPGSVRGAVTTAAWVIWVPSSWSYCESWPSTPRSIARWYHLMCLLWCWSAWNKVPLQTQRSSSTLCYWP